VQNKPVREVLETFRQQLALEIRCDEAQLKQAGKSLDTLISLDLKNVTVDDLLRQTLMQAGLKFERKERVVEVRAE
jgi:hypothetical protein